MAKFLFLFCICFCSIFNKIKVEATVVADLLQTTENQWEQTNYPLEHTSVDINPERTSIISIIL